MHNEGARENQAFRLERVLRKGSWVVYQFFSFQAHNKYLMCLVIVGYVTELNIKKKDNHDKEGVNGRLMIQIMAKMNDTYKVVERN